MNREIKFRGKSLVNIRDIKKGDWIYGGVIFHDDEIWIWVHVYGCLAYNNLSIGDLSVKPLHKVTNET